MSHVLEINHLIFLREGYVQSGGPGHDWTRRGGVKVLRKAAGHSDSKGGDLRESLAIFGCLDTQPTCSEKDEKEHGLGIGRSAPVWVRPAGWRLGGAHLASLLLMFCLNLCSFQVLQLQRVFLR